MAQTSSLPLVSFPHRRSPWYGGELVHVLAKLGHLKGTDPRRPPRAEDYAKAKKQGDFDAAARIVRVLGEAAVAAVDRIVDAVMPSLEAGKRLLCAVPHPPFDDLDGDGTDLVGRTVVKNALPLAYRAWIADTLGAEQDVEIVQAARVGRSKLTNIPRFLCQPAFDGAVDPNAAYILADDVFTIGGTLASLRSHIMGAGGSVVALTTLAHGSGLTQKLALSSETWDQLASLFGEGFGAFWEAEIGHDSQCLTESEGQFLIRWATQDGGRAGESLLQRLRGRLAAAAATGE